MFKKSHVTILEGRPDDYKNKIRIMLTDIGEKLYTNKLGDKPTPIKTQIFIKKAKKKEDNMKKNLRKAKREWV